MFIVLDTQSRLNMIILPTLDLGHVGKVTSILS